MKSISLTEFLEAFFPDKDEKIYLRALKAKDAPDNAENNPKQLSLTRRQLQNDVKLQTKVKSLNKHRGMYFVVNAGGNQDNRIKRFNAFFVENDNLSIDEQNKRLDEAILQPSIRLVTKKSVHAYWLIEGECNETEWRDIQHRLIGSFSGDKSIHNPSRVMRLPFFNHVSVAGEKLLYKRVELTEFELTRRYTVEEMQQAF